MATAHEIPHPQFWRTFWSNAVMAPRTSLGFMRVDFVLGTVFVIPLTQMVFFAFVVMLGGGGQSQVEFTAIGNAVATVTYSSVFSVCQTTDSEKQQGTMEHLLVSPAGRLALYFGRGLIPILVSLATVTMGLVYAVVFFGVTIPTAALPSLAVSVVLTAFAMVGFGLLLGGLALYLRTSIILGNIFLFVGLLLSGVNFPLSSLPPSLQIAGDALPLTWGLSAIRAAISGESLGSLGLLWAAVGLSGIISLGLAMGLWEYFNVVLSPPEVSPDSEDAYLPRPPGGTPIGTGATKGTILVPEAIPYRMLESLNLIAFLTTSRPAESKEFYADKLGLIFMGEDPSFLIFDSNGIVLRIQKAKSFTPSSQTALGWEVSDVVHQVDDLIRAGVKMLRRPGLQQDQIGIWTAPDGTMIAWFQDPDGNVLTVSEHAERV